MNNQHTFPVVEVFGPTLQGEGYMAGQITHFVRFGGCTYRCEWCDSMYAVEPAQVKKNSTKVTAQQIVHKLAELGPTVGCVTLTGGDPCIHKHMQEVIDAIREEWLSVDVIVETQGAIYQKWLEDCDFVTLSPKGPSSKQVTDFSKLDYIITRLKKYCVPLALKVVIFTEGDIEYALDIRNKYPKELMSLQIGTPPEFFNEDIPNQLTVIRRTLLNETSMLFDILQAHPSYQQFFEPPTVRILPQVHTLLWGTKRGV